MKSLRLYPFALVAALILNLIFFGFLFWSYHTYNKHQKSMHPLLVQQALSVHTVTAPTVNSSTAAYAVAHTFHHQATITHQFKGPGNLQGLVLAMKDAPHQQSIAYFEPIKKLLILGQVINQQGINTTINASEKYLIVPQEPVLLAKLNQLSAIITGAKQPKHRITVLVDPNAPLFRDLYQAFQADTKDGLQVRWVLVNYLKPMGPNLAAWILQAAHPTQRLVMIARKPLQYWQSLQVPSISQSIRLQLRQHWGVMQENHLVPGPITAFRTAHHSYILHGLIDPESFESMLPSILDH